MPPKNEKSIEWRMARQERTGQLMARAIKKLECCPPEEFDALADEIEAFLDHVGA